MSHGKYLPVDRPYYRTRLKSLSDVLREPKLT